MATRWNPSARLMMPVDGVDEVDLSRVRDCIELGILRRDWLRDSSDTLTYMLRTYNDGIHSRKMRKLFAQLCSDFEGHLTRTLKKWKNKLLTYTFGMYLPEDTPKYSYTLELYKSNFPMKRHKKDFYFTISTIKTTATRMFKFPKDQSQRYWT